MRIPLRTLSIALLASLLLLPMAWADNPSISWDKEQGRWVATLRYEQPASGLHRVKVKNFTGDMEFHAGKAKTATVVIVYRHERGASKQDAEADFQHQMPEFDLTAGTLRIDVPRRHSWRFGNNDQFSLTATLPVVCDIDAGTAGGQVTADGFTGSLDLATSGGDVTVSAIKGDVDLATSGGDIDLGGIEGDVSAATSGGEIRVRDAQGAVEVATSGGNIEAEKVSGSLEASTSGGNISAKQLDVSRVSLATSGGEVVIEKTTASERGEFSTSGGDIEMSDSKGDMELATHGGDLRVDTHDGNLDLSTSAGNIRAKDVVGGVSAETSTGDIRVSVAKAGGNKARGYDLNTGDGDIELVLPADFSAFVEATVSHASHSSDKIDSDFPLDKRDESGRTMQWSGKINGGGVPVELMTGRGRIHIVKR